MIRKILLRLTVVCLLLLMACADPTFNSIDGGKVNASTLSLSLSVDGMGVEVATRAAVAAEQNETDVRTLTLFFFEPAADRSGVFVDWVELDNEPNLLPIGSPITIPVDGKDISASDAYNVIGVANAGDYLPAGWKENWTGNEAEFRQNMIAVFPSSIASGKLLMNGSAVKTAGNGLVDMKLTRNVARIDVENKASGYSLVSAELRNIYNKSSVTGDATLDYANSVARQGVSATATASDNQIKGKLYAFENRTTTPTQGDAVTSCLIIGLENGSTKYYRINVHPEEGGQYLRRNKVYAVSITDVNGPGYSTPDEAYTGTSEGELDFNINNWDLGDNGLIVSDSYSILALPVKKVQIGNDAVTLTYTITTFSTLESPTPLAIKGTPVLDSGLGVSLSGNILTVTATVLGNEVRNGSVTLTYAGLEATMDIVQSLKTVAYLKLSYETGWKGLFPSMGGNTSKSVLVNASGSWKATLIGDDGFSFDSDNNVTEISNSGPNGSFTVTTISANPSKTVQRNAFVIVALDDDPLNCVAVVSLTQAIASNISIDPVVENVIFNGSKSITEGAENNVFTYTVSSFEQGNPETPIELSAIISAGGVKFDCSLIDGILKIWTKGTNSSPNNYTGKLKIAGGGAELVINLTQRPLSLSVAVTQPTAVGPESGETGSFYLSIDDNNAKCRAAIVTRGVERDIFNHKVRLVYADTGNDVSPVDEFTANTPLKIIYPFIYFPNREIDIRTTVTYTTQEGATATYTFTQNKLTSEGLRIWSTYFSRWGSLTPSGALGYYIEHFNNYIRNNGPTLASPGTYSLIASSSSSDYGNAVPANTNWFQFSNNDADQASEFTGLNKYFNGNSPNRLTVIQAGHGALSSQLGSYSFAGNIGYSFTNSAASENRVRLNTNVSETRVYQFIMINGRKNITNINGFGLYNDGINCGATNYPEGAVPLLQYINSSGGFNNSYNLVIDPVNNMVFHGDETVFYGNYYTNNSPVNASDKSAFMANYIDYLVNAAKYGRHFTDMLRNDGNYATSIPAMWDEVWKENRWPTRSN